LLLEEMGYMLLHLLSEQSSIAVFFSTTFSFPALT